MPHAQHSVPAHSLASLFSTAHRVPLHSFTMERPKTRSKYHPGISKISFCLPNMEVLPAGMVGSSRTGRAWLYGLRHSLAGWGLQLLHTEGEAMNGLLSTGNEAFGSLGNHHQCPGWEKLAFSPQRNPQINDCLLRASTPATEGLRPPLWSEEPSRSPANWQRGLVTWSLWYILKAMRKPSKWGRGHLCLPQHA